ncbi:hypothetical protein D0469_14690 [Peribacillus saganii]|uniref:Uncharacterized protein n=1 Tax=Peribacillus saganii TaxID=2303992 RepID=A0A372LL33_9BACI|nr:hypothetical protein [Peribacillus saganii]RFU67495.1 hypothetical protein D0469_14690 [Peribacillus saganii]
MCFSTNAIETQAYETALKIREASIYKFVRTESADGNAFDLDNHSPDEIPVITKVILEDNNGHPYSVEPNPFGLKFAKGEINYNEYKKSQNKDVAMGIGILCVTAGLFLSISWAFVQWMT